MATYARCLGIGDLFCSLVSLQVDSLRSSSSLVHQVFSHIHEHIILPPTFMYIICVVEIVSLPYLLNQNVPNIPVMSPQGFFYSY